MASYAKELENRVLHPNWNSKSRRVGRLRLVALCDTPNEDFRYSNNVIGAMAYWLCGNDREDRKEWILKVYFDGTAVFRQGMLSSFNGRTRRSIKDLLTKYFYTQKVVTLEDEEWNKRELTILQRKPCSNYSGTVFNSEETFGDYLVRKYNRGVA